MRRIFLLSMLGMLCISNIATADLVINEVLANPNGPGAEDFDANMDGNFDVGDDEFIEFVNTLATSLDISNWTVNDGIGVRHTFAAGTVLNPGQAFVLFGGGSPSVSNFGGALVDVASTGTLGINNGGDTITVFDLGSVAIASVASGTGVGVSSTRDPDLTGGFVLHDTLPGGFPGTPGFRNDGTTSFSAVPEPGVIGLLSVFGVGLIGFRRRS